MPPTLPTAAHLSPLNCAWIYWSPQPIAHLPIKGDRPHCNSQS
ncbi:hypothetical protein [Vacuolonema iberomarrocanum]